MSRIDIRLRRRQVTQGRIESHKNYNYLMEMHQEQSRRKTRGIMVMVFLAIMVLAITIVVVRSCEKHPIPQTESPADTVQQKSSPYDIAY